MISVIICSVDSARFSAAEAMYRAALGAEPFEIIGIRDARSLAEGYNRGMARSCGEIVVFSHDDVEVLSADFAGRLRNHLARFDLIGLAGTTRLINAGWSSAGPPYLFGQMAHLHTDGRMVVDVYCAPRRAVAGIQGLDGVFMAVRRSVLEQIKFDAATFDGFHLYDVDFSYQAYRAGFRVGVVCDIHLLHHSVGKFDQNWAVYAERFITKWRDWLPAVAAPPQMQWSAVLVESRAHALEVMSPTWWDET